MSEEISQPPSGTTLTKEKSKKILQALHPAFIQLQEAERQTHQPKWGTSEKWLFQKEATHRVSTHTKTEHQLHRKPPPKQSRNTQICFGDALECSCGKERENKFKRLYPFIFNF